MSSPEYQRNYRLTHKAEVKARNTAYRESHRPRMRELWRENRAKRLAKNNQFIREYKQAHPCACGEGDPVVLCFHHVNPATKNGTIEKLRKYSRARVEAEMAQCVVLCFNCHVRGHAGRPRPEHKDYFPVS